MKELLDWEPSRTILRVQYQYETDWHTVLFNQLNQIQDEFFFAQGTDPYGNIQAAGVIRPDVLSFFKTYEEKRYFWQYEMRRVPVSKEGLYAFEGNYRSVNGLADGLARALLLIKEPQNDLVSKVLAKV